MKKKFNIIIARHFRKGIFFFFEKNTIFCGLIVKLIQSFRKKNKYFRNTNRYKLIEFGEASSSKK